MNSVPTQHFVYSFSLGDTVAHFHSHSEATQVAAERFVVEIIYESFVVPGDQDYLMARLLAQKGLPRGFYWAAAQTVEKYLKALLLIRGHNVDTYSGHPLLRLFKATTSIESTLNNVDISRHPSIKAPDVCSSLLQHFSVDEFLQELETHGAPDNRYNALGVKYNTGHLFALDSLAYRIRGLIGVPPINKSLECFSEALIVSFNNANPWFSALQNEPLSLPTNEFPLKAHGAVTTLEFISNHRSWPECNIALTWLSNKMKLAKSLRAGK